MEKNSFWPSNKAQIVNLTIKGINFEVKIEKMRPKIVEKEVRSMAEMSMNELKIKKVSDLKEKKYELAERIREKISAKFPERMALEIDGLKVEITKII